MEPGDLLFLGYRGEIVVAEITGLKRHSDKKTSLAFGVILRCGEWREGGV